MARFEMYDDGYDVGIIDSQFDKTETNSESDCFVLGPFAAVGKDKLRSAIQIIVDELNG